MLSVCDADCALLGSGMFRSDQIHPAGDFRAIDLYNILPYQNFICILSLTGNLIVKTFIQNKIFELEI